MALARCSPVCAPRARTSARTGAAASASRRVPCRSAATLPCRSVRCRASEPQREEAPPAAAEEEATDADVPGLPKKRRARQADSTDPISTFLTRRFGLAGGLAWLAVLTFGVVSEQLKTRMEVAREASGTQAVDSVEVTTASGLRYRDTVRGGGETAPQRGYLLAADVRVTLGDDLVLFDTASTGRPLAFFFGARPFQGALCAGVEEGIAGMRAGGTRVLVVPPQLAFPAGAKFPGGEVPPDSTLTYTVKLLRVSVPPS